jgi:hypothetical protein
MQPDVHCARARAQGTARECLQLISFALGVVAKGCSFVFRIVEQSTPEGVRTDYCPMLSELISKFFSGTTGEVN